MNLQQKSLALPEGRLPSFSQLGKLDDKQDMSTDLSILKRCLTQRGVLHAQAKNLSDRDLYFLRCAWLYVKRLEKIYGITWHNKYSVALCRTGCAIVAFIEEPVLDLTRFFNDSDDECYRFSIKRILEEGHCAQGVHVPASDDRYSFDVMVWVRCTLNHLTSLFSVRNEKVPGCVSMLQLKSGFSSEAYQYNMTCSYAMIMSMVVNTRRKVATDHCNCCMKTRAVSGKLLTCQRCLTIRYCGRSCQIADWKAGHSHECKMLEEWAKDGVKLQGPFITVDTSNGLDAATSAVDSMLNRLQVTDPDRYKSLTVLV